MVLQELVKMLPEHRLPIVIPSIILKLLDDPPFVDEFLFPASKILLVPGDIVEADS